MCCSEVSRVGERLGGASNQPVPVEPASHVIDAVTQLPRGARPSRNRLGEQVFVAPSMPTPSIARPTIWTASQRSVEEVLGALDALAAEVSRRELVEQVNGVRMLLAWLQRFPGESWQQRWQASGADQAGNSWPDIVTTPARELSPNRKRGLATGAASRLILLDAIRPSYDWLYSSMATAKLATPLARRRDPQGYAALEARCLANPRLTSLDHRAALIQLGRMLMHNGGTFADVTLADCVEAYRAQTGYGSRLHSHWYTLLREQGILGEDSPPTIHAASRRGRLSIQEIVDGYGIENQGIRDLFVDYLRERQPGLDYSTIRAMASKLLLLFWRDLEIHEPGISSLHLNDRVARAWKERLGQVRYGNRRLGQRREDPYAILMTVRAFYADLSHWALEDPARWGRWAAPSPVDSRDLAGMSKSLKQQRSRMHQRTRELAPLLPRLIEAAAQRRCLSRDLLDAGTRAAPGEVFSAADQTLRRTALATDPELGGEGRPGVLYATTVEGTGRRNLTQEAGRAFWAWASVEVFRHTGVRIEEMLEITHRSFVSYRLPATGEVIPMLQITPSKTDKERLLVISPELASVFAEIIHHVRADHETIPLVSRYDQRERVHSPGLPFLFQRRWGVRDTPITNLRIKELLDELVIAADIRNTDGTPATFTPHDFRRIFATEAVSSGLPVHIAAKILGHDSIATTQTYIAIYDQDVIDHHRAFIARRRANRPSEEYREPTDSEWDEFLGHFAKRKLELGTCGRAYGSGCQHEHACIRCPMLRPDPNQHERLQDIIDSLAVRIAEAQDRGWVGEVDGLRTSLAAAQQKIAQMQRTATNLGMPMFKRRTRGS